MQELTINRENKDRLFKLIFGRQENRAWTLSLYNAVNGSSYTNPDDITITTVEDVLYLSMKNDISFLIADTMNLYEHQSTYNPNMPVRMLTYAAMVYSKYITGTKTYMYSEKLKKLPSPRLLTFYNGTREMPDETILRLSDSFTNEPDPCIEVKVRMLNINYGRNAELLEKCRPLNDYSIFIENVRLLSRQEYAPEEAVHAAIRNLGNDSPIRPFLIEHEAEVAMLWITEYDETKDRELFRQDCLEEGKAEGRAEGFSEGLAEGKAEGKAEGEAIGAERMRKLISCLMSQNRIEDLEKVASDTHYTQKLLKEFNL